MRSGKLITSQLVAYLRTEFRLEWHGFHGAAHWARVRHNGLRLARRNGAITTVIELFAFLHDVQRRNDGDDPEHGPRAALLVAELNDRLFSISSEEQALLEVACRNHTGGTYHEDLTVRTCWDADRLDLGRVGVRPDPDHLCTPEARNPALIEEAWRRSRRYGYPTSLANDTEAADLIHNLQGGTEMLLKRRPFPQLPGDVPTARTHGDFRANHELRTRRSQHRTEHTCAGRNPRGHPARRRTD